MKLNSILKKVIVESGKFEFLYNKNVKPEKGQKPNMDFETFKAIILADPDTKVKGDLDIDTITVDNMEKVKAGKYSEWLIKNFLYPKSEFQVGTPEHKNFVKNHIKLFMEDLYKVSEDLNKFERAKPYLPQEQRDINKFTPKTLFELLKDFEIPEKKKKKEQEKEIKQSRKGFEHTGSEIVLQSGKWTVIKIEGTGQAQKDAACYFGGSGKHEKGETRWCTSAPGLDYWKGYLSRGPLYVIFPNDATKVGQVTGLPKERYQFHFPDEQFMDRDDNQIKLVEFLESNPELKEFFKPELFKSLTNSGKEIVKISYPNSKESRYLALYGFDDIFNIIPVTVKQIMFNNKSNENITLSIPKTIGKFKDLTTIFFENCLEILPEEIGDCKKLKFISLPKNERLTSLPDSILKLNLEFLNLQGCPNLRLPKNFYKYYEGDEGHVGFYTKKDVNL